MKRAVTTTADLEPPREVVRIVRRLEEAGFSTWAVGGAVRDALAGRRPGDWDLATAARPGDVQRLFRRTVPVGVEHGTVGVLGKDGHLYEVTTFRRDVETDGRRARVQFADTIDEDLARRDFSINAVAWHPLSGEVRDPFGGAEDLRAGVLRTVGNPAERFREDRLRVLRALRFAGRFGLEIHPATWAALSAKTPELGALSAERVRDELRKSLREIPAASRTLQMYAASGALEVWYPELHHLARDPARWTERLRTVDAIPRNRPLLRLAALLRDTPAGALMTRLRFSNTETDRAVHLVAQQGSLPAIAATDADVRRWLRTVGPAFVPDLLRLEIAVCRARGGGGSELGEVARRVRGTLRKRPPLTQADLAIDGRKLIEVGIRPGPRVGEVLRELLDRVLENPALNTPADLERIARELA